MLWPNPTSASLSRDLPKSDGLGRAISVLHDHFFSAAVLMTSRLSSMVRQCAVVELDLLVACVRIGLPVSLRPRFGINFNSRLRLPLGNSR